MITLRGGCHCQNIAIELAWPDETLVGRKCACTFCTKHSAAWASHVESELHITVADSALLSKYLFGTKTAEFYVCARCGIPVVAISTIDGIDYAVVNVSTIDNLEQLCVSDMSTSFEGEATDCRLDRRKRNWIGRVYVEESDA